MLVQATNFSKTLGVARDVQGKRVEGAAAGEPIFSEGHGLAVAEEVSYH